MRDGEIVGWAAPTLRELSASVVSVATAAVIYIPADLFISPHAPRVRTGAASRDSARKHAVRAARGHSGGGAKQVVLCPIGARLAPLSTPFDKSSPSAFSPAGRGFGPFLAARRFIIS